MSQAWSLVLVVLAAGQGWGVRWGWGAVRKKALWGLGIWEQINNKRHTVDWTDGEHTDLPENLSLDPSTHITQIVTASNFSFKGSDALFWVCMYTTSIQRIQKLKINLQNKSTRALR